VHSLYTTNDRGVNEVALREIPHPYWFMRPLDLFIELPQLTRRGFNDLHKYAFRSRPASPEVA